MIKVKVAELTIKKDGTDDYGGVYFTEDFSWSEEDRRKIEDAVLGGRNEILSKDETKKVNICTANGNVSVEIKKHPEISRRKLIEGFIYSEEAIIQKNTPVPKVSEKTGSQATDENILKSQFSEMNQMEIETPTRNMNDLIVPSNVKKQIETAINRIRYHEVLYEEWNLRKVDPYGRQIAVNLYGPSGTGKTFCAEAIAHHLNKRIIKVNYAEIESKYVGETPKRITAAFRKAKETDTILFFDEADSILGKRLTNVTQSEDHGVNVSRSVMLLQLDAFDGIVIFASNLPSNYDSAFVRRILAHIEFELPDKECLIKLWAYLLPNEVPRAEDVTTEWLVSQSEGLSGGDILNIVKLSASQAVSRTEDKCKIFQSDILDSIAQVRSGKEKVGRPLSGERKTTVSEKIVPTEELPSDVRKEYDKVVGKSGS